MKLTLTKTRGNIIFLILMLAATIFGTVAATSFFAPCAIWFIILFILCLPSYEIKGGAALSLDLILPLFGGVFTIYFAHLINIAGHDFFEGEDSLLRYIGHGSTEPYVTLFPMVIFFYFFFRIFAVPRKFSAALMPLIPLLFALVDYYVYSFRGQEFMAADITGTGTAMNVASNYEFDLYKPFAFLILPYIMYICVCLRIKTDKSTSPWYLKTAANLALSTMIATAFVGSFENYYTRHQIFSWGDEGSRFNGFLLNFTMSVRILIPEEPEGYLGASYYDDYICYEEDSGLDDANIIVIMNESYCDPDFFFDDMTSDPDPFWDELTEDPNCISGIALSSVYGGRTPNSEFEMLTGITTGYLPAASIPYSMYVDGDMPSVPNYLRNLGYYTTAMHPYLSSGWNRTSVYPRLGFEKMMFLDDFDYDDSDKLRDYLSDMCAYKNLIAQLEEAPEGQKTFTFLVTMQNHGGYTTEYDNFDVKTYVDDIDDGWEFPVNNYVSLVAESDKALEMLVDYLRDQDEDYVLLVFGDHQPAIDHMGTNMGPGGDVWWVPYLIWTNYDMPDLIRDEDRDLREMTSFNYFAIDLLRAANVKVPAYFEYINDIRRVLPAINAAGYYSAAAGRFMPLETSVTDGDHDALMDYRYLQYNIIFDDGVNALTSEMLPER